MPETLLPAKTRLTAQETADRLGYNLWTIYRWAKNGTLPCIRRKRNLRFRIEDLERWEKEGLTGRL